MPEPFEYDQPTLAYYNETRAVYSASGPNGTSRFLEGFMQRLPSQARILELGCGGGRDAEAMIANGFTVDATDGVAAIAREAEARLNKPVRVMRFDELEAVDAYDGVWAHASLIHVPKDTLPGVLRRIYRALRPGGIHFANYKAYTDQADLTGRYFNYMNMAEALDLYSKSASWTFLDLRDDRSGASKTPWVVVTVQKP
jgi:SAM-dependent methyltransferase